MSAPFSFIGFDRDHCTLPVVATAIHAGHQLRDELVAKMAIDARERRREEDAATEVIAEACETRIVVHQSRFECDMNRRPDRAVYRRPEQAWGLHLWQQPLTEAEVARSMALYHSFYAEVRARFDELVQRFGRFVVLDFHAYNYRRSGPDADAADPTHNAQVDIATVPLDMDLEPLFDAPRWRPLLESLLVHLRGCHYDGAPLDARLDVRWKRGHFSQWVDMSYPGVGCAIPIEIKKTYVDEWSHDLRGRHATELRDAFREAVPMLADMVAV